MPRSLLKPVLFFDFDNTLMQGDILDEVVEKYSPNEAWRDWENAWAQGHLPARDCLRLQVGNMRVSRERLFEDLTRVRIDPAFAEIVEWAKLRQVGINIVSDSFVPLIRHILRSNGIDGIPVFANDLRFLANDRLVASFPFYDPACERSANAKARHLMPYRANRIIFWATATRISTRRWRPTWCSRNAPSRTSSMRAASPSTPSIRSSPCSRSWRLSRMRSASPPRGLPGRMRESKAEPPL